MKGSDLVPAPENYRLHPKKQREAMRKMLGRIGIVDGLIAYEREDGTVQLINGHMRADEFGDIDWPVTILDVTEAEAREVLATLDPLSGLADIDKGKMEDLIKSLDQVPDFLPDVSADAAKKLKPMPDVERPMELVWVLVCAPMASYPEVDECVQKLLALEGVSVEVAGTNVKAD